MVKNCLLTRLFSFFFLFYPKKEISKIPLVYLKGACPDFTGRKHDLEILDKDLIRKHSLRDFRASSKIKVLWGKGGFGKSELAIEFANRFFSHFSLIWTFYCDSGEHIDQSYRKLAEKLGISDFKEPLEKVKEKVHFYLENHSFDRPWLLIFDNVENDLAHYPQRGGVILITSQKKILNPEFLLEVKPFSKEESLELLEKITGEKRGKEMESLVQELEGIPLLINYAAHYIKATPGCSSADYYHLFSSHLFEKEGPFCRDVDINGRYLKSLAASWKFPLESLKKETPQALEWLFVCSYLYPEQIPEQWIDDWLKVQNQELQRKEILKALQTYGVIRYDAPTKTFSLHRFFQHMIRESRKEFINHDLSQAIFLLAKHAQDFDFTQLASWKKGELWFMHAHEVEHWMALYPFPFSKDVITFYEGFASYCFFKDRYADALETNYKILKLLEDNNSERGRVYQRIGWLLLRLGKQDEALQACELAERWQEKQTLEYAETLMTKGKILCGGGDYSKALHCYEQALKIRRQHLGENHVEVGRTLFNMTRCLDKLGRGQEVLQLHPQIENIFKKTCGLKHPFYAWSLEIKAKVKRGMGEYEEALKLFDQSLSILLATRGPNHGELAPSWYGKGWCYYYLKDYAKAKKAFKKAFRIGLPYYGENSYLGIRFYRGLGMNYIKEGRIEKGLTLLLHWYEKSTLLYANSPKLLLSTNEFKEIIEEIRGNSELLERARNMISGGSSDKEKENPAKSISSKEF